MESGINMDIQIWRVCDELLGESRLAEQPFFCGSAAPHDDFGHTG